MTNINKRSMRMMMLIVFIGLITAIGLCIQRNAVEKQSTTIEQAMDFDAVVLMARNDGYDLDTALQMARDAGVTSFTIYDTTLNKLTQRGELSLVTKLGADLYYPQFGITDKSYDYYLIGKPQGEEDLYFDEVVSDLSTRLGSDKVKVMSNGAYRIAGLKGVMPGLGDVNLGIMSADAKIISDHGFYVILRPTNYSNPTKADVDHFFARADKIQDVSGIMFVGKEVLGYTCMICQVSSIIGRPGSMPWPRKNWKRLRRKKRLCAFTSATLNETSESISIPCIRSPFTA